jgi:hypothetical protein
MNQEAQNKKMGQVITKACRDDSFKQRLLSNATVTLKAEGIEVPAGMEVRVVEDTDKMFHLVIPWKPTVAELSDDELDKAAGGAFQANTLQ